jgi:hypothetical protein
MDIDFVSLPDGSIDARTGTWASSSDAAREYEVPGEESEAKVVVSIGFSLSSCLPVRSWLSHFDSTIHRVRWPEELMR